MCVFDCMYICICTMRVLDSYRVQGIASDAMGLESEMSLSYYVDDVN